MKACMMIKLHQVIISGDNFVQIKRKEEEGNHT